MGMTIPPMRCCPSLTVRPFAFEAPVSAVNGSTLKPQDASTSHLGESTSRQRG